MGRGWTTLDAADVVTTEDGSPIRGGPGPSPIGPMPEVLRFRCVACGAAARLEPGDLIDVVLPGDRRPRGSSGVDFVASHVARRERHPGCTVACRACGSRTRLVYDVGEWGKMSGRWFPAREARVRG